MDRIVRGGAPSDAAGPSGIVGGHVAMHTRGWVGIIAGLALVLADVGYQRPSDAPALDLRCQQTAS
jgi:hypothetical protein